MGMEGTLKHHLRKFMGILNGIDHEMWSPETDPHLPHKFVSHDLRGKAAAGEQWVSTPPTHVCPARPQGYGSERLGGRDEESAPHLPHKCALRPLSDFVSSFLTFLTPHLAGKAQCKAALLRELGLPHDTSTHPGGRPLLAIVTRLTEQKGLPLLKHGVEAAIKNGAQVRITAHPLPSLFHSSPSFMPF